MLAENKKILLTQALDAFHDETGLRLTTKALKPAQQTPDVDAAVLLTGNKPTTFNATIKKWVQQMNPGVLIEQIQRLPGKGLLVADYVNPNLAERFRQQNIQYIDAAGNAYINERQHFVYVKGKKQPQPAPAKATPTGRAFTQAGLKVIYAFLCEPDRVNTTYREIARQADVALGTVERTMNDLKAGGYLIRIKGQRRLVKYRHLLDRWIEVYPEKLRPKQWIGLYTAVKPDWWQAIDMQQFGGYWGSEIAGRHYTKYLRPAEATVYIEPALAGKLLAKARLRKLTTHTHDENRVRLYRPFWPRPDNYDGYVHPLLAYADLVASGDGRDIETAGMIFDEHIARHIRED